MQARSSHVPVLGVVQGHEKLTFRHASRDFRLTDVAGNVIRDVIA